MNTQHPSVVRSIACRRYEFRDRLGTGDRGQAGAFPCSVPNNEPKPGRVVVARQTDLVPTGSVYELRAIKFFLGVKEVHLLRPVAHRPSSGVPKEQSRVRLDPLTPAHAFGFPSTHGWRRHAHIDHDPDRCLHSKTTDRRGPGRAGTEGVGRSALSGTESTSSWRQGTSRLARVLTTDPWLRYRTVDAGC